MLLLLELRRHQNTVVVYDKQSQQLTTDRLNAGDDLSECPYCHRPFESAPQHEDLQDEAFEFISPQYFRRLAASRIGSQSASGVTSPHLHLVEPTSAHSTPTRNVSMHRPGGTPQNDAGISQGSFSQGYFKTFFKEERELGRGGKG